MRLGLEYAERVEKDEVLTNSLRAIVAKHYYEHATADWLASPVGRDALQYEAVTRYLNACRWVVPWARSRCQLDGAVVVDIGAGTGATQVAFAEVASRVVGYEIEAKSVAAARDRFELMGTTNAEIRLVKPKDQLGRIKYDHPNGASIVLLFAVLEHLTQEERFEYLSTIWRDILLPGGYLIVVDTPNRLGLFDFHTSHLPFFHLLPPYLALKYFERSPRAEFAGGMRGHVSHGQAEAVEGLHRWGLGASFHDFEVAFGVDTLDGLIVANGFEWEMTCWFPPGLDDQVMIKYFLDRNVQKDLGFAKAVLNLIFRKPASGAGPARPSIDRSHLEVISQYHGLDPRIIEKLG